MINRIDIADADFERIGILQSPSYNAPPPDVVNIELIPDKYHKAMSKAWYSQVFRECEITIDRVFNVFLTNEGLAFTKDLKLIEQTRTQHSDVDIEAGAKRIKSGCDVEEFSEDSLLLRKRGEGNYGHWLVEILPKLNIALRFTETDRLVIPHSSGPMKDVIKDSMEMVRPDHPTVLARRSSSISFFKSLIIVDGLTSHGTYMSPLAFCDLPRMLNKVDTDNLRRIYVARPGSSRSISNEEDMLCLLSEFGFTTIDPGSMTFSQQISAFKSAEIVVGVMGAAMTNIMFCSEQTHVVNIAPSTFPDTFFYLISSIRGQKYHEIRGKNDDESDSRNVPFRIDLQKFRACLECLMAS